MVAPPICVTSIWSQYSGDFSSLTTPALVFSGSYTNRIKVKVYSKNSCSYKLMWVSLEPNLYQMETAFLAVFYKTLHRIVLSMELYYYFNGIEGEGWFIQTHLINVVSLKPNRDCISSSVLEN